LYETLSALTVRPTRCGSVTTVTRYGLTEVSVAIIQCYKKSTEVCTTVQSKLDSPSLINLSPGAILTWMHNSQR